LPTFGRIIYLGVIAAALLIISGALYSSFSHLF
jgi:hypothetical protein